MRSPDHGAGRPPGTVVRFTAFRESGYGHPVTVVINHLHLSAPLTDETVQACREAVPLILKAGASAARIVRVDDTHLVLILEFSSPQDADRVASEVGGPWMREHILPLLAHGPERSVGEVIA
jgi:hypothetical protein